MINEKDEIFFDGLHAFFFMISILSIALFTWFILTYGESVGVKDPVGLVYGLMVPVLTAVAGYCLIAPSKGRSVKEDKTDELSNIKVEVIENNVVKLNIYL